MRRLAGLLALTLLVGGCGSSGSGDGRPSVVASFYPLAYLVERIGGADVRLTDLTPPGAEPHDLELSPRQAGDLEDADLVVYLRGFQPAIDDAVPKGAFDVTDVVPLNGGDPHIWLEPALLYALVNPLRARIASIDEGHRDAYVQRGRQLYAELERLDREFVAGLKSCKRHDVVFGHDAFGYLTMRHGLRQIAIGGRDPEAEPSPARVGEVIRLARAAKVTTVFVERLDAPGAARTVADEIGARLAVLDPVERVTGDDDYFTVMRRNLAALRLALDCA